MIINPLQPNITHKILWPPFPLLSVKVKGVPGLLPLLDCNEVLQSPIRAGVLSGKAKQGAGNHTDSLNFFPTKVVMRQLSLLAGVVLKEAQQKVGTFIPAQPYITKSPPQCQWWLYRKQQLGTCSLLSQGGISRDPVGSLNSKSCPTQ